MDLDLNALVKHFHTLLRRTIREDITLDLRLADTLPPVSGDAGQLEQVVMNLAVSDTGCGMDEEIQAHVFEPFFTTKNARKGTGLGLATVHGIVAQHEGHVWVYSEPGKGTTVKVYLPVAPEAVSVAEDSRPGPENLQGSETVLLVEDSDPVRAGARTVLTQAGYTVLTATDGTEALALASAHEDPLHLLLNRCGHARDEREGTVSTPLRHPSSPQGPVHVRLYR